MHLGLSAWMLRPVHVPVNAGLCVLAACLQNQSCHCCCVANSGAARTAPWVQVPYFGFIGAQHREVSLTIEKAPDNGCPGLFRINL